MLDPVGVEAREISELRGLGWAESCVVFVWVDCKRLSALYLTLVSRKFKSRKAEKQKFIYLAGLVFMFSVEIVNGKSFAIEEGELLLDAAARVGVHLNYSCKTGRCGSCKCKLIQGETVAKQAESGLTEEEKVNGWILSCARSAKTNVILEVDDLIDVPLPHPKTIPCRIDKIERLSLNVVRVLLRLSPNSDFRFMPGQYVDVIGAGGIRRSYSIANKDFKGKTLELHIRAVDGGVMSNYWFGQAKENDLLRLHGPLGTFFVREIKSLDVIFLATGTGIAPVKAMVESMADADHIGKEKQITVIWGGRVPEDLYFDFTQLPGNYRFVPVLSRAAQDWKGARGYVQDILLKEKNDLSNAVIYACGSDSMIQDARRVLVEAGFSSKRFFSDAFLSSEKNN